MNKNVLACITAFYPGKDFEEICRVISIQSDFLLIVDNSPECTLSINDFILPDNVLIVHNKNVGAVAGALNIALELARYKNFSYLQIFDQDTFPPLDITSSLINTLKINPKAVLVSPRFINLDTNHPGRVLRNDGKWRVKSIWPRIDMGVINVLFTISSASLINIKLLPVNAFYDERLIIDGCDVDFCLFLSSSGLKILVDTSRCIVHGIGYRKKGGGRWSPTNYSSHRKLLSAKNRVIVWRRYFKQYPGFVLNDIVVFSLDTARTVFFEKEKISKLKALLNGLWQGLLEKNIALRKP